MVTELAPHRQTRFSNEAIDTLMEATTALGVETMVKAAMCATHARRGTVMLEDFKLPERLNAVRPGDVAARPKSKKRAVEEAVRVAEAPEVPSSCTSVKPETKKRRADKKAPEVPSSSSKPAKPEGRRKPAKIRTLN